MKTDTLLLALGIFGFISTVSASNREDDSTGSPFHCFVNRSAHMPTSVHELRPSDIRVIATIGDSLSAGMGALSNYLLTVAIQYRGHSFTIGGGTTLEEHTTMPNILKKFNPQLTGFSTGVSGPDGPYAQLNVAVVGDKAEDMPYQARKLVARMRAFTHINFEHDWKVINLFIGGNDVCDYCKDPERHSATNYKKHITEALDYFAEHVPRAFVNLIEPLDASAVADLKEQETKCKWLLKTFWCKCGAGRPRSEVEEYSRSIQKAAQEVVSSGRYENRTDFTVVLQPFLRYTDPPMIKPGVLDMTFFAPDCFHFSAKGHSVAAKALWNNMLEPVGSKKTKWSQAARVNCPTEDRPYLATSVNSKGA